jgi:hypothetical protein
MPTLHSHTHYQAAQTNASTQAWQRVCLSNRTTKTTDKTADEEEHRTDNTGLAKVAVQCSADTFVVNQSLVLRINICGENRHLRQARKRYATLKLNIPQNEE